MSGKVKKKAQMGDGLSLTVNERILKECHKLYIDSDDGLIRTANSLGLSLLAPRKKITILLIGNHSAGKSSFINWYVEEHVQRTGVAIETQGFSFVTSGRKRESLTGNATLHLYPHFEPLRNITGVVDYLTTEISTSKQKKFPLVTFVDTPGLVDGDMKYSFDVNQSIAWLGDLADIIFVFFDPIGQALCKRTLNIVEKLNEKHPDKIRFYLSKADEAGHESDRQRVMMQIVQELCKRPGLNKTGFDMPTIFIPNVGSKTTRCVNQIEDVCKDIERTINQTIQNTLNALEKDCERIGTLIDEKLDNDRKTVSNNFHGKIRSCWYCSIGLFLPFLFSVILLCDNISHQYLSSVITEEYFAIILKQVKFVRNLIPADYLLYIIASVFTLALVFMLVARCYSRSRPTLTRGNRQLLGESKEYIDKVVRKKKATLYKEYLQQAAAEQDI